MKKKKKQIIPLKLDLAAFNGNLTKFPLPYEDASIEEVQCVHKLEYIPGRLRTPFMEELYRIMIPGGKVNVVTCYWSSPRAIQDPALEWPPICEQSFLYFNKGWREANKLPPIKADFDFSYGYQVDPETAARNQESQSFWLKHYVNTATDLQLVLTRRP